MIRKWIKDDRSLLTLLLHLLSQTHLSQWRVSHPLFRELRF